MKNNYIKHIIFIAFLMFAIILSLSFVSFVSAQTLQKQNTDYTFLFINDNATSCNITYVQYPDNAISVFYNKPMSKNGQSFNYIFTANNFSKLGETCFYYSCLPLTLNNGQSCINVTADGRNMTLVEVIFYIFILILVLLTLISSFYLAIKNPISHDLKPIEKYNLKKKNNFLFYINLLKKKLWMVGVFGIYLSLFLFTALLNNVAYNLGISEINLILITFNNIMAWLSIPFVIFWFVYIGLYLYSEGVEILKYDFGGIKDER